MPPHPETRRGNTFVLWGSVLAVVIVAVVAVRYLTRERVSVYTAKVSYQASITRDSSTTGKVQPVEDAQVRAQVPGIVEQIYVHVGEKVQPGQMLMRMDDQGAHARLDAAKAALQAAQISLGDISHGGSQDERNTLAADLSRAQMQRDQAAADLAAKQKLLAQGAASPAEVAAAQQTLQLDESDLHSKKQHTADRFGNVDRATAEAHIADAQSKLADAQSSVVNSDIRSQIAGTVYYLPVSQYDNVSAGDELVDVADLNRIQVTGYFDEPEVGNLAPNQPVKIVWEAKPNMIWHGHITTVPTTIISYNTRNVGECIITVDDARGDLEPNANVTVTVTTAQHFHVLSIPREALRTDGPGSYYVFRIINNKLVKTPIQVAGGVINYTWAEITGGLREGDVVALNAATTNRDLTDGLEVKPIK